MKKEINRISGDQKRRVRWSPRKGQARLRLLGPSLAYCLARRPRSELGERVKFDFHDNKYRQLTGVIIKINAHSYIVRLEENQLERIQELVEFRKGNGCVCVSQRQCRRE